jgi:hypothetical protein
MHNYDAKFQKQTQFNEKDLNILVSSQTQKKEAFFLLGLQSSDSHTRRVASLLLNRLKAFGYPFN